MNLNKNLILRNIIWRTKKQFINLFTKNDKNNQKYSLNSIGESTVAYLITAKKAKKAYNLIINMLENNPIPIDFLYNSSFREKTLFNLQGDGSGCSVSHFFQASGASDLDKVDAEYPLLPKRSGVE
jgi:hypothetical protein